MQYHLNGFRPGDPELLPAAPDAPRPRGQLPDRVDVLIVGCGPAGLTLAAQLAAFPQISTCIVERKSGPLEKGQADGISCRSMEMFNAFGFAEKVLKQGYWVNETTFWKPDPSRPGQIARTGRIQDVEDGLSEMPHIILNQARIHDMYLEVMRKAPSRLEPDYGLRLTDLSIDDADADHPVHVTLAREDAAAGEAVSMRARYVVGCDGARSNVRRAIGRDLKGNSANQAWGVMDVLAVTEFPDIRCKTLIQSAEEGNIIVIPREGGYLVRLYIELDKLKTGERVANRNIGIEQLVAAAQRIFRPYSFDVREVVWWSVYEIGQRLTDKFDDVPQDDVGRRAPRVFIAGDACHTHSPKAGQGMNVSMGDAFNLGWKLVSVLTGRSSPDLLHSYSAERQAVASDLIEFDREWSRIMSERPSSHDTSGEDDDPPKFQSYFIKHGRYTAGMSVTYAPSAITGDAKWQHLAPGFPIGERFHSAPVLRLADGKPMELGHTVKADARWRIFAFGPDEDPTAGGSAIRCLSDFLTDRPTSPVRRCTGKDADVDEIIDVRAVFQQGFRDLAIEAMPPFLLPRKGRHGLIDYEKMFCAVPGSDIFDLRGIDRQQGCLVILRPDQHVAHVLPIDAFDDLAAFFAGFTLPA